jgi:hypothetical protein
MKFRKLIRRWLRTRSAMIVPVIGVGVGVALFRRQRMAQMEAANTPR